MLTTEEAAEARGVSVNTIHMWVKRGKLTPAGRVPRPGTGQQMMLFLRSDVMAVTNNQGGRPRLRPPIERVCEPPAPLLPAGLRAMQADGRFVAEQHDPVGGGVCLGRIRIGTDWLRVYRSESGVVYHELAEWMADDADWMEDPAHRDAAMALYPEAVAA